MCSQTDEGLFCPPRPGREPAGADGLLFRAPAKLNLILRVLGRRADGYHEIDSIVAKVTLYDELMFRRRRDGRLRLECSGYDCGPAEENLVLRAARLLRAATGRGGAAIRLHKRIPPGAGLGGGSSDAAATLEALNQLWELELPQRILAELAARLGSDVPLFLNGPAVGVRGRGERVEPVQVHPFFAVLQLSDVCCKTADVYAAYDEIHETQRPLAAATQSADLAGRLDRPPGVWRDDLFNDLQPAAAKVYPRLAGICADLARATGLPAHMTGSGGALFVLTDDEAAARRALEAVPADLTSRCRIVSLNPW